MWLRSINLLITRLRYAGAVWRTRGRDDRLIAQYRCKTADQVFYIIGAGGTVNDLSEADCAVIEAGTSASVNMAGVAPLAVDIYAIEAIIDAHQGESLAAKMRSQQKPAVFWLQDRRKYANVYLRALQRAFPVHSYVRASLSVRKQVATYHHIFQYLLRPAVFDAPNLNVSFAVTGSIARLVLLGCALAYRNFFLSGLIWGAHRFFGKNQPNCAENRHGKTGPEPMCQSQMPPTSIRVARRLCGLSTISY